jgi:hypothetical protein
LAKFEREEKRGAICASSLIKGSGQQSEISATLRVAAIAIEFNYISLALT